MFKQLNDFISSIVVFHRFQKPVAVYLFFPSTDVDDLMMFTKQYKHINRLS